MYKAQFRHGPVMLEKRHHPMIWMMVISPVVRTFGGSECSAFVALKCMCGGDSICYIILDYQKPMDGLVWKVWKKNSSNFLIRSDKADAKRWL